MDSRENILNFFGIARKARLLETGEENCAAAVHEGKAKVLFLASDASENAARRAEGFVYGRRTPLARLPFTKAELSAHTGRAGCSMVAVMDLGIAARLAEMLAETDAAAFGPLAEALHQRQERSARRKAGAKAPSGKKSKTGTNRRRSV